MQIDFHYYATYAMARAAGIKREVAAVIASAAQYVDESTEAQPPPVEPEGARLVAEVTAHTTYDVHNTPVLRRTEWNDQQLVWVPFHFLPGGQGSSLSERLVCVMDSPIAQQVAKHAVERVTEPFGVDLLGVVAHVYADTFSHRGFAGVGSRRNRVLPGSIEIQNDDVKNSFFGAKLATFKSKGDHGGLVDNFRSSIFGKVLNKGALGHGSVETCPDQPFLAWSFTYEAYEDRAEVTSGDRVNPMDYEIAAQKLYDIFSAARSRAEASLADAAGARPFDEIRGAVQEILWFIGDRDARSKTWSAAAQAGKLFKAEEPIPAYGSAIMDRSRSDLSSVPRNEDVRKERAYRFYQAAAIHRTYVLRELLPEHGIVLV